MYINNTEYALLVSKSNVFNMKTQKRIHAMF